ncbi:MAG: hypothetical protein ABIO69_01640 [Sphingomicrobium sp.]
MPKRIRSYLLRRWNPAKQDFLVPGLSFEHFIEHLDARAIAYAVLERGASAPEVLVSDWASDLIQPLTTRWPVGSAIKLYTPSGRPGTAYVSPLAKPCSSNRIALFPNHLANGILERAEATAGQGKVPSARDAFFARAYRAAYLEGVCCSWSEPGLLCATCVDHRRALKRLAAQADIALPRKLTHETLDQLLSAHGWRPAGDLLEKAAEWAPWLGRAFPELQIGLRVEGPGVAAFFIREQALANNLKGTILATLEEHGFDPLLILDLNEHERASVGREFRGGNWGQGPWNVDGGRPGCIVITLNRNPLPVPPEQKRRMRECDDWQIICAKEEARKRMIGGLERRAQYNGLHATDTSDQAWRVVRKVAPDQERALRRRIEQIRQATEAAQSAAASPLPGQLARA